MTGRLAIVVYLLGSCLFHWVAAFKLWWCLFTANTELAKNIALQYDDTANVALNGDADVKISTRLWLNYQENPDRLKHVFWLKLVDGLFYQLKGEINHCYQSYLSDKAKGNVK